MLRAEIRPRLSQAMQSCWEQPSLLVFSRSKDSTSIHLLHRNCPESEPSSSPCMYLESWEELTPMHRLETRSHGPTSARIDQPFLAVSCPWIRRLLAWLCEQDTEEEHTCSMSCCPLINNPRCLVIDKCYIPYMNKKS